MKAGSNKTGSRGAAESIILSISYFPSIILPTLSSLPLHFYRQGRAEDAKAVLQRLRGPGYDIEPEGRKGKMDQAASSFGAAPF